MALTAGDVRMWAELAERKLIPPSPRVLEIGQANWYGDIPVPVGCEGEDSFEVARNYYKKTLDYSSIDAIDMSGPNAFRLDLNQPLPPGRALAKFIGIGNFDVVINSGTTEHIFDQRQVFETIHDACAVGGLMVHAVPTDGWRNHGFYTYSVGFFNDLASANLYSLPYCRNEGDADVTLYVVLRKTVSHPFKVPTQRRYLPWTTLR